MRILTLALVVFVSAGLCVGASSAALRSTETGAFVINHELTVPVDPETAYDHLTGDISGWWDHRFKSEGGRFFIEARPGGGFYEYFDDEGNNGVLHGTVIYAERGKGLTFEGPLGFNGKALQLVVAYTLEASGDGTKLGVEVHGSGELEAGWVEAIDGVWQHLLVVRFLPYVEALTETR